MVSPDALMNRAEQLRAEVTSHKAAIRRHRAQLGTAKAALDQLEAECRRLGIGFTATRTEETRTYGAHRSHSSAD